MWSDERGLQRDLVVTPPPLPPGVPPDVVALCGLTVDEWTRTLLDLLPRGAVWPRDAETILYRFWMAIADAMMAIQVRDCDLLAESYPCGAEELLPDWEAALGLPDECTEGGDYPIAMRQALVCAKLASTGGQTVAYYIELAAFYGYTIAIVEHWPWRIGCASFCDARIGVPIGWWEVIVPTLPVAHLTVGCWRIGEPLCTVPGKALIECVIRRAAPANTIVTFSYVLEPALWNKCCWNSKKWSMP